MAACPKTGRPLSNARSTKPSEHIDVDLTGLLRIEINLDQAADKAMDVLERTIRGRLTAADALRHNEFVLTKLYESA